MRRPCLAACSLALSSSLVLAAPSPASAANADADPAERAQTLFEEGAELYARERYAESAKALAKSYALDPKPEVLFAWGQAERLAGNCGEATRIYHRYLETDPDEREREHTRQALDLCVQQAPAPEKPVPPPPDIDDTLATRADAGAEPDGPASPRRERSPHAVSTGLLVGGSTLAAGGLASLIVGGVLERRARNAETYQDYQDRRDPDSGRARGAVAAYAAGGVLSAAGVGLIVGGVLLRQREADPGRMSARPSAMAVDPLGRRLTLTWRLGPRRP